MSTETSHQILVKKLNETSAVLLTVDVCSSRRMSSYIDITVHFNSYYKLQQGCANIFYGGPHWRFSCYRGPHARVTYIAPIRFGNLKKVLHELPQSEGNNSHFRLSKNGVSNETCW